MLNFHAGEEVLSDVNEGTGADGVPSGSLCIPKPVHVVKTMADVREKMQKLCL